MPLTISPAELEGVLLIESPLFKDERGYFTELHSVSGHADAGFRESFVQDNLSKSRKGTLRGMHYQIEPHGMGKLVRAVSGAVFDVAVDLRRGSPTFGKWTGHILTGENGLALWVPVGFAHGFLALERDTLVLYKCTAPWNPGAERSLAYDDPEVAIAWPMAPTCISGKDRQAPRLSEAEYNFTYPG